MLEIISIANNGNSRYPIRHIINDRPPFTMNKIKKNLRIGLNCMEHSYSKETYHWLSSTEYSLIKALNPDLHTKLTKASMSFAYETYATAFMPNSTFKQTYIPHNKQQIYIQLHKWVEVTYKYTTKFNLTGLIKQLQATNNLMRNYKPLSSRPSLIQVLTQIYYNPDYIKKFIEHPIEHLQILQDTDFYHYFKMLHPETVYSYDYMNTE